MAFANFGKYVAVRAGAYALTGDVFAEEARCIWQPKVIKHRDLCHS